MITFTTRTGSVYELQLDGNGLDSGEIRRLTGVNDPTPRQGPDGEWNQFTWSDGKPIVGQPYLIGWRIEGGVMKSTVTSEVKTVTEVYDDSPTV
jgi:hypothetical protein